MENKAHAFVAGAFVIGLIGLIVALVLWFTHDTAVRNIYEMSTSDPVSGLQPQATVRFRGVSVGKVQSIDFDPKVRGNVRVRISVDERVPLTKSSYAALSYQGVTGLAAIALNDDGTSQEQLVPDNSNPPRIPLKPSTLAKLQERGEAILEQVEDAAQKVNALVSDENRQRVAEALENIAQAAKSANQLTKNLDATVKEGLTPALKAIPPLADNTRAALGTVKQAASDVSRVANNLNSTVTRINAEGGPLDRLAAGTEGLGQALDSFNMTTLPRVNRVADDAAVAVRRLGRAAENINENPQSLLFGSGSVVPGPGEPGFATPAVPATAARP
ncbi:MlaD family protein [Variovorax sp. OV329]|uniref:MlaD family protein n=1 Tax=Variovorax sp. OV329 TaxID=1882825 RepID=UPI0008E3D9B4|nr:MlaD family protein [Variovorax sp. OV329]SFN31931.1 phospholipid/cholesterol/gamma-HCH transport system substrate-binding protein [Variovorax sp. OV329]